MTGLITRSYRSEDFDACLAIFDSNTPAFFAPEERPEYRSFLMEMSPETTSYLVLEREGRLIGCGGLSIDTSKRQARFEWGMIVRTSHSEGLGTHLAQARLDVARARLDVVEVGLETSQLTRGFYERFGFSVIKITPDGFGPGLDRCDMILQVQ